VPYPFACVGKMFSLRKSYFCLEFTIKKAILFHDNKIAKKILSEKRTLIK